ncbi:MAG: hydrogenase maturation protease [Geobacteraceae bacterium]|nr:hydrogenase maturation protease [Geobacteraceae bacterium]
MLAIVGVGNTLAGDDGAGVEAVHRLRERWGGNPELLFHVIEGDHFEIVELLDHAERFIFIDAFAGDQPGKIIRRENNVRAFAPSFHQTDISAVMDILQALGIAEPFPPWEVWGVTIAPPSELGEGFTPEVAEGVDEICAELQDIIVETVG